MLITVIAFIVILSILVFVHELGHYLTARYFGVNAEEFGFGFPPRICGWRKANGKRKFFWGDREVASDDTIYSLNWVPLGGFVKIKGENGENSEDKDSFASQRVGKRAVILSAGVIMNVILCMVCLIIAFMVGAPQVIESQEQGIIIKDPKIQVVSVIAGSPAEKAGFKLGDVIAKVDGNSFDKIEDVQNYIQNKPAGEVSINVERLSDKLNFSVKSVTLNETGKLGVGIGLAETGIIRYPWYLAIWLGIKGTWIMAVQIVVSFATVIKNLVTGVPIGVDVAGPVGIAIITSKVARMGFIYILQFTALLSLNLAIINFLPFPALDGGRFFFLMIEKLRGRAVNQKIERAIHTVGFSVLLLLIVLVTGRDVMKFKESFINIWHRIVS